MNGRVNALCQQPLGLGPQLAGVGQANIGKDTKGEDFLLAIEAGGQSPISPAVCHYEQEQAAAIAQLVWLLAWFGVSDCNGCERHLLVSPMRPRPTYQQKYP